jgi:hypothetical protein
MVRLVDVSRALAHLEQRVARLAPEPEREWVCWFTESNGREVTNPATGEVLSLEEFDAQHPDAYRIDFDLGELGSDPLTPVDWLEDERPDRA